MKNKNNFKKFIDAFGCAVVIATLSLTVVGCGNKVTIEEPVPGAKLQTVAFNLDVVDTEGNGMNSTINTTATNVYEALLELDIISGEETEEGFVVKTVNGITLDSDDTHWAFYIDGKSASTSVDATDIVPGTTYSFRIENN